MARHPRSGGARATALPRFLPKMQAGTARAPVCFPSCWAETGWRPAWPCLLVLLLFAEAEQALLLGLGLGGLLGRLLFGGALLIISLILLSNTIRLAIFSKRYLINTMKLVGATKWFIMKPFLGSSITQGILAGLGASLLFGLSVFGLNEAVPELTTIAESGKIAVILGAMIAGGVVISGLFTVAALNKFVNMKSNKIYLY